MSRKSIKYAKTSDELLSALKKILAGGRDRGDYIVDRNKCTNFGLIFKDGTNSISAIDMFCERLFSKKVITILKKDVDVLSDDDQAIVDEYLMASEYVKSAVVSPENADTKKLDYCKMVVEDLPRVIRGIEPIKKSMELPFYVNPITKGEFPVYCLSDATDENIEMWATKLSVFTEAFKGMITPAAFNPYLQPNGLEIMKIRNPKWIDIVIR